jgi:hypothetical protein
MTPKICQVIFSTNRIEYLCRTLEAQKLLDFSGCRVDKIFIDDFPKGRNDLLITHLVKLFGYNEIYLHEVNKGLSVTWTEFWNLIRNRDYDYVWHQEDDVEIIEPVKILDIAQLLELDKLLSQVVLKRQAWYSNESETQALGSDWTWGQYRYERQSAIFSPMASLYSIDKVRFNYSDFYAKNYPNEIYSKINFNEGMLGKALLEDQGLISAHLKTTDGKPFIHHIGDYFVGQRVLPNEPHYDQFAGYDPEKKYYSKNGAEYR